MLTRRRLIEAGGGVLAAVLVRPLPLVAAGVVEMAMRGTRGGSHVWFDPVGIHLLPGQTLRWTNDDPGNSHTVTAYHPNNFGRSRRIPAQAEPWDSGYLLPGESFEVTLTMEGVYDYYCVPHEHAGMVGRIVAGLPPVDEQIEGGLQELPEMALGNFPSVDRIVAEGRVTSAPFSAGV